MSDSLCNKISVSNSVLPKLTEIQIPNHVRLVILFAILVTDKDQQLVPLVLGISFSIIIPV